MVVLGERRLGRGLLGNHSSRGRLMGQRVGPKGGDRVVRVVLSTLFEVSIIPQT